MLSTKQIRRTLPGKKITEEVKEEEKLVDSDLWKTLFRGGSMVSKLTRSLSGAYYVRKAFVVKKQEKEIVKFSFFSSVRPQALLNRSWLLSLKIW